jgi:uncharacterized protein (TIGR01777 family)
MNILVTGGTGFIGNSFISNYRHRYRFTILTRQQHLYNEQSDHTIQYIDSLDSYTDLNAFDAVINLAGEPIAEKRWTSKQKQLICQSRWQITEKLTTLINNSQRPPKVFISGSAIGYYGRQKKRLIDEQFSDCHQEFSHTVCQRWEKIALKASANTRVCLLRTGIVLDRHHGALKKMLPSFYIGLGALLGNGKQMMSWIHIEDMVRAINYLLLHDDCHGAFNLTAPNALSNKQFSHTLAKAMKRKCLFAIPKPVLQLLFGEMAELFIYGQQVIPQKLLEQGFKFNYSELEQALANLFD